MPVETRGYGAALIGGIRAARGRFVIMGDADDSYDFSALEPFVEKLREGDDLVMGNRFQGGIRPGAMPPLHRYLGNPVLSGIGRLFFRSPCGDFHCGMRGFRRDAVLAHGPADHGHGVRQGDGGEGDAARPAHDRGADHAVARRPQPPAAPAQLARRLAPPALPAALQPALAVPLSRGAADADRARRGGVDPSGTAHHRGVGFDVHTLTYAAAAVLIGFQSIAFAVFSKVFAINEGLLPEDPRFHRLFSTITLEVGLLVGAGVRRGRSRGLRLGALRLGGALSFGELDPSQMLRIIIPATLALALGCQIVLTSFFLSVLGLGRQRRGAR